MPDNSQRSKPHRHVEQVLNSMKVSFMSEVAEFPPYTLDIYLPELHSCIEIDGSGHYPKKDNKRDEYLLETFGIDTFRIKAKGAWSNQELLKNNILAFMIETSQTYEGRIEVWKAIR